MVWESSFQQRLRNKFSVNSSGDLQNRTSRCPWKSGHRFAFAHFSTASTTATTLISLSPLTLQLIGGAKLRPWTPPATRVNPTKTQLDLPKPRFCTRTREHKTRFHCTTQHSFSRCVLLARWPLAFAVDGCSQVDLTAAQATFDRLHRRRPA